MSLDPRSSRVMRKSVRPFILSGRPLPSPPTKTRRSISPGSASIEASPAPPPPTLPPTTDTVFADPPYDIGFFKTPDPCARLEFLLALFTGRGLIRPSAEDDSPKEDRYDERDSCPFPGGEDHRRDHRGHLLGHRAVGR